MNLKILLYMFICIVFAISNIMVYGDEIDSINAKPINHTLGHKCIHDTLEYTSVIDANNTYLGDYNNQDHIDRVLQQSYWQSIRIYADYSGIAAADYNTQNYVKTQFFPTIINFFQNALKVIQIAPQLTIPAGSICSNIYVPRTISVQTDLYVFISMTNEPDSSVIAWGLTCVNSNINQRPIIGQINLNLANFHPDNFLEQLNVVKHEFTHVLGFSKSQYALFINPYTNRPLGVQNVVQTVMSRQLQTQMIITPKVKAYAQQYFNCPGVSGLELENQGLPATAGSHWESRLVKDELMIAYADADNSFSPFTGALLEDSGWYQVDYSYTQQTNWGRGKSCTFLTNLCIDSTTLQTYWDEFCTARNTQGCSYNGRKKAMCATSIGTPPYPIWNYFRDNTVSADSYTDNCPYMLNIPNGDCRNPSNNMGNRQFKEYYGPYGRCFEGNFILNYYAMYAQNENIGCFESHCYPNPDGSQRLQIIIGTGVINCPTQGGQVYVTDPTYQGYVKCPPAYQVCYVTCPHNCYGNGQCIDGACQCYGSWTGVDCSQVRR